MVSAFEVYVMFLPFSGLRGAAPSSLLFSGLDGVRGMDGLRGWLFAGQGLAARGAGGIVTSHLFISFFIFILKYLFWYKFHIIYTCFQTDQFKIKKTKGKEAKLRTKVIYLPKLQYNTL